MKNTTALPLASRVGLLLCCGLLLFPWAAVGEPTWVGRPLAEALEELRGRGMRIVFSSGVVLPSMRIAVEPGAGLEDRELLDELLEPHGLAAQERLEGIFVVVPRDVLSEPPAAGLHGRVVSARDGLALPGATVELRPPGSTRVTDAEGLFEFSELAAGRYGLEARLPGFVIASAGEVEIQDGASTEVDLVLQPSPPTAEEIEVAPSRLTLLQENPASLLALDRDELLRLPHLGGDLFRALPLMPGTVANDVSARFHVRGGRRDEVQILVDGQEIYDAFHLKDFDGALSIMEADNLERVDLSTGGFPGQYGDRMSGVLDMTTVEPQGDLRHHLGIGVLTLEAGSSGLFDGDRGSWIVALRRGSIDLAGRLLGREDPRYWDLFGKATWAFNERQKLQLDVLGARDVLDFGETTRDGELKHWNTEYGSAYAWLTHEALIGDRLLVESALSWSQIDRDRDGLEDEEEQAFVVHDERDLEIYTLRQAWSFQATPRQAMRWGIEVRDYDSEFDYFGERAYDTDLAALRHLPGDGVVAFQGEIAGRHDALWASDKLRLFDRLTLDLGLRWDRLELLDESFFSPRINLSWAVARATVVRAAWGHYYQSQRPYELQVEDGETTYARAERSEHRILGVEHHFRGDSRLAGWAFRLEAYSHHIGNPRARYENLYEAINVFPEVEPDRVRIAPESSRSQGLELLLRGRLSASLDLWLTYAASSIEDRIEGRDVPRQVDQRHALNARLGARLGPRWNLDLAWRFHTGWPTTPLSLVPIEGLDESGFRADDAGDGEHGEREYAVVLGPLNSERLADYHRLDLRLSRRWKARRGELTIYVDVQNLYDRKNVAGFDIEIDDEAGELVVDEEAWPGIFPSLGIRWRF